MNNLTAERLEEFFERYGWTYSQEADDTWITGVRTSVSAFRIMVRLTEHWVFFIINPLVVAPPRPDDRLRVYYHALRYNLDMNFAKIGVDSDGDLFMAIELPTENFVYSHFVDALDGLSHHASMIYAELFGLSHNPERTEGRYDHELALNPFDLPAYFDDDDDNDDLLFDDDDDDDLSEFFAPDDILIDGRRLKITDDGKGGARVELEGDEGEDKKEEKPKRSPKKRDDADATE